MYDTHKSWYSWVLGSLVGAVYTFGFILMCPQVSGARGVVGAARATHTCKPAGVWTCSVQCWHICISQPHA
jgi:hypothetical protein